MITGAIHNCIYRILGADFFLLSNVPGGEGSQSGEI